MASIGKINTALTSLSNELTVAAANFNLDFSVIKVEAPKEFHGVRDALSASRRGNAEDGAAHVTARKLGALFESIIPPIPHLIGAYGKRVSEISSSLSTKSTRPEYRLFAKQAGFDGTSIWAAATSGKGAIATHLLACMLARMWNAPEAISLWVELVDQRKRQITSSLEQGDAIQLANAMAARQDISREQLAAWDASARSWLLTADKAKELQQIQLMLVLNNIRVPVNMNNDAFDSVMEAWTTALTAVNHLVQGIPQRVTNGATLLAISSWHIYPDMHILASEIKSISQKDGLTTGATLTLSAASSDESQAGVFWSLPLSCMRYYSPPMRVDRRVASATGHVSLVEFRIVWLGAILASWLNTDADEARCCTFIIMIAEKVKTVEAGIMWLEALHEAAKDYIGSQGTLKQRYHQLIELGFRRSSSFLDSSLHHGPFFGLQLFYYLFSLFSDEESTISILRQTASTLGVPSADLIIRYKRKDKPGCKAFEYCSAIAMERRTGKRTVEGTSRFDKIHHRWILREDRIDRIRVKELRDKCKEECTLMNWFDVEDSGTFIFSFKKPGKHHKVSYELVSGDVSTCALFQARESFPAKPPERLRATTRQIESIIQSLSLENGLLVSHLRVVGEEASFSALSQLHQFYQDIDEARINLKVLQHSMFAAKWVEPGMIGTAKLTSMFACIAMMESGELDIDPSLLNNVIAVSSGDSIFVDSRILLDPAQIATSRQTVKRVSGSVGRSEVVFMVPTAEPTLKTADIGAWCQINHEPFDGRFLDSFTGTSLHLSFTEYELPLDVGSKGLRDRQAIILESVISLDDRGAHQGDLDLISVMTEPYNVVGGSDCFFEQRWHDCQITRLSPGRCKHKIKRDKWKVDDSRRAQTQEKYKNVVTSLDSWEEFFDPPHRGVGIFRGAGNWEARLAATAASLQLHKKVLVLPPDACMLCLDKYLGQAKFDIVIA